MHKVWGGGWARVGERAQSVLESLWQTCWQQGCCAMDILSKPLWETPEGLALPPRPEMQTRLLFLLDPLRVFPHCAPGIRV
jgi:hypothetical protein